MTNGPGLQLDVCKADIFLDIQSHPSLFPSYCFWKIAQNHMRTEFLWLGDKCLTSESWQEMTSINGLKSFPSQKTTKKRPQFHHRKRTKVANQKIISEKKNQVIFTFGIILLSKKISIVAPKLEKKNDRWDLAKWKFFTLKKPFLNPIFCSVFFRWLIWSWKNDIFFQICQESQDISRTILQFTKCYFSFLFRDLSRLNIFSQ